jgi:hypothetical protein
MDNQSNSGTTRAECTLTTLHGSSEVRQAWQTAALCPELRTLKSTSVEVLHGNQKYA